MNRSPAQLAALAEARAKRKIAIEPLTAPEGYRSVEHFLDDNREYIGRFGLTTDLARYLGVNESSVRKWVKREKTPRQPTIDAIAQWRRVKAAGL